MQEVKEFTLGEVASLLTGCALSTRDPYAKDLIEWISGEPASEATWLLESPNRVDYCRMWVTDRLGHHKTKEIEFLAWEDRSRMETQTVPIPKPGAFPSPYME